MAENTMTIRTYQSGDELDQASIYNTAACSLPGFKPASVDDILRRYRSHEFDPTSRFYAVRDDLVVGYVSFDRNDRISYPWCLPGYEALQAPLIERARQELKLRGRSQAWAAYRADWTPILAYLENQGFARVREILNYVAELGTFPQQDTVVDQFITPLVRDDLPQLIELGNALFPQARREALPDDLWRNAYFSGESLFAVRNELDDTLMGAAILVVNSSYADPMKLDANMPCFRLGAFGTEGQRHKRVNGMFSCLFQNESTARSLLGEAVRRGRLAGLTHLAAQAPSDRSVECDFLDRYFDRQGMFPILACSLDH
jgi:hypothetical protein